MKSSLLSIFVVTYNRSHYLKKCLESILTQQFNNYNLIILDNHSTDNTIDVINSFKDERIKHIRHRSNIGGVNNINYAFSINKSKYFVIFHDDDLMHSDMILSQINILENNPTYSMVSANANYIDELGEIIKSPKFRKNGVDIFKGTKYLENFLKRKRGIICPSVMYRSSFFLNQGLNFKKEVGPAADQFLWFLVERSNGIICKINMPLMDYRVHKLQDSYVNSLKMDIQLFYHIKDFINLNKLSIRIVILFEYGAIRLFISSIKQFITNKIEINIFSDYSSKIFEDLLQFKVIKLIIISLFKIVVKFSEFKKYIFQEESKN